LLAQYNITKRASAVVQATNVGNSSTLSSTRPPKVIKTTASQCYPDPNSNRIQFVDISGPPVSSNVPASSCLDAGSKPDHLRNLCHCRSRQRRDQEASWRLMGMRQPRRPELGQREDRSPPRLCQRSLTLQSILTVGSKSGHLHSLHRCRNRPCTLQVLDWRPQGSPQPRSPDVAAHQQCNSRSRLCLGRCSLAPQCILTVGRTSGHLRLPRCREPCDIKSVT